uniref:SR6 n=1 Tax=Triticum aestivum TaxID=4565 RepID=A0AAU7YR66_WHEAT
MEDAYLVPAILWLVQTILGTLGIRELDSWIRQAGLQDDIENLRSELEVLQPVASDAKGMALRSARLAKSLADLKRFLYDADDLIDELDYFRLQHQVEGVTNTVSISQEPLPSSSNAHNRFASDGVTQPCTAAATTTAVTLQEPEGMHEAAPVDHAGTLRANDNIPPRSGRGKKRSKAWDDFEDIKDGNGRTVQAECRHCKKRVQYKGAQGTRVLITHVNSAECKNTREARPRPPSHSSIDDADENAIPVAASNSAIRPRMETNQDSTQITAAITHPWSKDEISSRIREITRQLQGIRGDVTKDLSMLGSDSGASSGHHQSTASDPCRRTSSLLQGKVYGRDKEKSSIIKLMTAGKSDSVTVVPIVGIGGTGKTALAQSVYNDPKVQDHFDHIIWIWVSNIFDEMRISREMLDVVPREKHEGLCSLDKLQQVLKTHIESKRVLLILDDVWDDKNNRRLDLILAPFKSNNANDSVILVTTRDLSVAKRIGTTEPVVLGTLENEDLWLLLKERAFGDENYKGHGNLTNIGRKIAWKLKGNPLAAVTAGELLRVDLTVDHWIKILKDEDWKLLGLSGGIMSSLKFSYDQLPYHLHQCLTFCSIFPDNHEFPDEELVRIWISQGFVKQSNPSKRLEDIGMDYLSDLVNLSYFQRVGRKDSYVVCGLMHEFSRIVSRTDCAIIDGLECTDILPTVQHLSVECKKDQHGNVSWSSKFKEDLRKTVTSVRKLRTLLLIGQYDCSFFQSFEDIFQKAHYIRLLQISATFQDFNSLVRSSVNPTHLRYLKLTVNEVQGDLPQVLSNFCHLQVLDVGSNTHLDVAHGMDNLVSLRHLVVASIYRIGKLTSLQTLSNFSVQDSNGFRIIELQSMNDLAQLMISQLQNVKTLEEACGAGLRYKRHLEKLHLSWNMSDVESDSDGSNESDSDGSNESDSDDSNESDSDGSNESDSDDSNESENVMSSEPSTSKETEECLPTEVLEGLKPHYNLKHLQITGYNGAASPSWLARNISVTCLQTLYLNGCGEWRILPSLRGLPFLANLKLRNMPKVEEVWVLSLKKLVLVKMPKLERCSCVSLRDLNSCLRVLKIKHCPALKVFDLFGNGHEFKIEQKSWLPRLCELTLKNCRLLVVPYPLPSASTVCSISVSRVSKFPTIEVWSCILTIGEEPFVGRVPFSEDYYNKFNDELFVLDGNILAFHNLRFLTQLIIGGCQKLTSISLKGLSQLESLKTLKIKGCARLSGLDAPPEHALPSLEYLEIGACGIAWEWLSLILQHAPALTELDLWDCPKLESLQLNSCTTLQKLSVDIFESLGTLELHFCTALEDLFIREAAVCVLEGSQSLRKLRLHGSHYLESLKLHSCTALEELDIRSCTSLCTLEGFQSLGSLRRLYLRDCPGLHSFLEGLPEQDYNLCPRLEFLDISGFSFLATPFCKQLTSLQRLVFCGLDGEKTEEGLTDEQERGLLLLGSLTELEFETYAHLEYLPASLHRLRSLQVLEISFCPSISGLPDLPPSLEELRIFHGSEELKHQSISRASSKLKVKIDGQYVN